MNAHLDIAEQAPHMHADPPQSIEHNILMLRKVYGTLKREREEREAKQKRIKVDDDDDDDKNNQEAEGKMMGRPIPVGAPWREVYWSIRRKRFVATVRMPVHTRIRATSAPVSWTTSTSVAKVLRRWQESQLWLPFTPTL